MAKIILQLGQQNQHLYYVRGTQYKGDETVINLGGVDQYMYMSIPEEIIDGYIPNHPDVDIQVVPVTEELYDKLKNQGECAMIDADTRTAIEDKYPLKEELKALRTDDSEYRQFVADIISKAKLKKRAMFGLPETISPPLSG